jgi:hypothetical protein
MSVLDDFLAGVVNAAAAGARLLPDPRFVHWKDIVSFRPPANVQRALAGRGAEFRFNKIEKATNAIGPIGGDINLDEYRVDVARPFDVQPDDPDLPPVTFGPELFAQYLRVGFGTLLGVEIRNRNPHSIIFNFDPEEKGVDDLKWESKKKAEDAIGAIMKFKVAYEKFPPVQDWAPVLASSSNSLSWIFTTVHTPSGGDHPVSGNRHFGIEPHDDGSFSFFNKGADRATGRLDQIIWSVGLSKTREIWQALQQAVADFVTSKKGEATVIRPIQFVVDWDFVKHIVHQPTEVWVVE